MFAQSMNYGSLEDLYSYLRENANCVIVENVQASPECIGLQEQTPPENLFHPATYKDEDAEKTSDDVFCRPSSPESSVGGCPSNSSEDANEAKTERDEVLADMRTTNDSQFVTEKDDSRGETQRSGVIGRRMRAYSDASYLSSVRNKSAETILRKCRRYMSFPHISTLNSSPHETEQTRAHETHTKVLHTQPRDFSTVSVLEISEGLGRDEEIIIDSEDPPVAENGPAPREELVKTWSREETRERSLSEPGPPYCELEFQRNASSRHMSDPGRLLLVESFDRVLARPSRIPLQKKLERLVEETPLEGDSGELARACSESVTSVPELPVERWTNSTLSHNVMDDVTISAVNQGNFSSNDVQCIGDYGSDDGRKFEHDYFPNQSASQDINSEGELHAPWGEDSLTHFVEEPKVAPCVCGLVGSETNRRGSSKTPDELCQVIDSAHKIQTTTANTKDETKRLVKCAFDEEEAGTRAARYYPLQLSAGDVITVTRSPDIERILEAEEVKRRLRDDLSSAKTTVRVLERETGGLRREIHRREDEIKALRDDVCRRQNLLDEVLTQDKQKSALVSGLQEMVECRRRTQDNELQELQMKVGEVQECQKQLGQVKRQLGQLTEHNLQFKEITEWFMKLDSKLSHIESAVHQLELKSASQEHKEDVDKPGHDQERRLFQTKLKNSEKERVLLEDVNKKLMQEVLSSLRVLSKREENSSICEARVKCKDLTLENLVRLESDNNALQKELQAVKTQLLVTKREVHALRTTDIDPTKVLLECENRALKAELNFFRERQAKTVGWTLCARLEETRRAREGETACVLDAAGDKEDASFRSWESSGTELEITDESSVCCDFTTECESDDSHRWSKAHSQRLRRMDKMMKNAAEKERSLRRCRQSTAFWIRQERKRSH